jgi:hypothetical protein
MQNRIELVKKQNKSIQVIPNRNYSKIGMNEVTGLREVLIDAIAPVTELLESKMYWNDTVEWNDREYVSRDGFFAYSHNYGGIELREIIPESSQLEFEFLEFGEPDAEFDFKNGELVDDWNSEGHADALLLLGVSFEGIDDKGNLSFYVYLGSS